MDARVITIAIFVVGACVLRIFTTDVTICAAMAGAASTLAVAGGPKESK